MYSSFFLAFPRIFLELPGSIFAIPCFCQTSPYNICIILFVFAEEQLRTWMYSMRTLYGKLTNPKKGTGKGRKKSPTPREKWVSRRFTFMGRHIFRHRGKSSAKVNIQQIFYCSSQCKTLITDITMNKVYKVLNIKCIKYM